ncbi:WLM-domain-containing protein [Saccharata proteae CBS 121410]|uniref:WLM-domain-containing protein n=1 Tax=Saccharata proteae CBS 121410 TaxID=1314787 RepID=A0A9P4LWZ6_9PEZI|nr:WLM-domain-containing protein [Saccharata proteae CBS 121410]
MREIDAHFTAYEHLQGLPRGDEALQLLRKIASVVAPIMRKRGWRVGTLCEFLPDNPALLGLNINRTARICVRLRYTPDPKQFLSYDAVLDTLLHELCHIVWGPHDANFHALWDELREEHYSLKRSGYTGEGFLSTGHKLGGKRLPPTEARRQAALAAANRRALSSGSGRKLGGAAVQNGADMRKVIADAATRRTQITKGCASGTQEGDRMAEEARRLGFRTKAEMDDADRLAIAIAVMEDEKEREREEMKMLGSAGTGQSKGPSAVPSQPKSDRPVSRLVAEDTTRTPENSNHAQQIVDLASDTPEEPSQDKWICDICTLENDWRHLCCDACGIEKPSAPPKPAMNSGASSPSPATFPQQKPLGWNCGRCGAFMESQWWTCSACGLMKTRS